jgi:crossover junction endodeoxyribonuclease RusA
MRTWTLELPYSKPPLTMNQRLHWRTEHRIKATLRRDVQLLARAARIPPLHRIAVELHYAPRDRRRRDPINLAPTAKVAEDGLVDAGVVPDDTPEYVDPTPAVIDPAGPHRGHRLWLVVRERPPLPST